MDWVVYDVYFFNNFKGLSWSVCIWVFGKYCRKLLVIKRCIELKIWIYSVKGKLYCWGKVMKGYLGILVKLYKICIDVFIWRIENMY